jgi:hypothetical protein
MALARIVTRSEACSRELAIDLLGRGYTVEIVSPDSVPPHRADLELRVEARSGEQLVANVVVRDGERSASLEFVRDLKNPSIFPVPTLQVNRETVHLAEPFAASSLGAANDFKPQAQPTHDDGMRPILMPTWLPSVSEPFNDSFASASSKIARPSAQPMIARRTPTIRTTPPPMMATATALPLIANNVVVNKTAFPVQPTPMPVTPPVVAARPLKPPVAEYGALGRTPSRFGMIAASLTSVALLLALVFGFSPRRTNASASAGDTSSSAVAPTVEPSSQSAASRPSQPAKLPPQSTTARATAKPAATKPPVTKIAAVSAAKAPAPKATPKTVSPHDRGETLIARDTVTYLEKPANKVPAKKQPNPGSRPRAHRSGEVAQNTVTYLNGMSPPSATAAKPAK